MSKLFVVPTLGKWLIPSQTNPILGMEMAVVTEVAG